MRHFSRKFAGAAALGLALAATACTPHSATTSSPPASSATNAANAANAANATKAATAPTTPQLPPQSPASTPAAPSPTASAAATVNPPATSAVPSATTKPGALPGVVADCVGRATTRPSTISLACADDGIGVQYMTWTTWTSAAAAGYGRLWLNLCNPNCAAGHLAYYPVRVTVSDVQDSAHGRWFRYLTITWESPRPSPLPLSTYGLMPPN